MEIPSIKTSFGSLNWHIPLVLRVVGRKRIRSTMRVNSELASEFIQFLNKQGRNAKIVDTKKLSYSGETFEGRNANSKYLISQLYSLAKPICITLGLVTQQEDSEMLTFFGRKLNDAINKNGVEFISDSEYCLGFLSAVLKYVDLSKWNILRSVGDCGVNIKELLNYFEDNDIQLNVSEKIIWGNYVKKILNKYEANDRIKNWRDRGKLLISLERNKKQILSELSKKPKMDKLRNFINLYVSLGLLYVKDHKYYLTKSDEVKYWNEVKEITKRDFIISINESYNRAKNEVYVPIPIIRSISSNELNIPFKYFDELLSGIGPQYGQYKISLIPPITKKVWGLNKAKKHYYYISIEHISSL